MTRKWNNVSAWSRKSGRWRLKGRERALPFSSFLPFYSRFLKFADRTISEPGTGYSTFHPIFRHLEVGLEKHSAAPRFLSHFSNIWMSDETLRTVINILLITQCKPRNNQDQPFLSVSWEPSVATYKGIHRWQGHLDRKKDHTATSHT